MDACIHQKLPNKVKYTQMIHTCQQRQRSFQQLWLIEERKKNFSKANLKLESYHHRKGFKNEKRRVVSETLFWSLQKGMKIFWKNIERLL